MKRIRIVPFLVVFSFLLFESCHCKKSATGSIVKNFAAEGYTKASIQLYQIDGCKFVLQLDSIIKGDDEGKRLEPLNLKEEFKKDKLLVWVKYVVKKGAVSTCMIGQVVDISEMELRKK